MKQFYQTINLKEEFIEQIPTKGNKIILCDLPEYQKQEIHKTELKNNIKNLKFDCFRRIIHVLDNIVVVKT